jgi:uncharacterized pyridoxamine 5'-phosphate oxidase family protein
MNNTKRELGQVYKFMKYIYYRKTDAGRSWTIKKRNLDKYILFRNIYNTEGKNISEVVALPAFQGLGLGFGEAEAYA